MKKDLVKIRIDLDIEEELKELDDIFMGYKKLPDELLFLKGTRYPISVDDRRHNIAKLEALNMISTKPYLAIHSVECVIEVLTKLYIENSADKELFFKNPLTNISVSFISKHILSVDIKELVLLYIVDNTIDYYGVVNSVHLDFIANRIEELFIKMYKLIPNGFTNNVIDFSIDSENIIFEIGDDIRSYRFDEVIAYEEANKEDEYESIDTTNYNEHPSYASIDTRGIRCKETSPDELIKQIIRNRRLFSHLS